MGKEFRAPSSKLGYVENLVEEYNRKVNKSDDAAMGVSSMARGDSYFSYGWSKIIAELDKIIMTSESFRNWAQDYIENLTSLEGKLPDSPGFSLTTTTTPVSPRHNVNITEPQVEGYKRENVDGSIAIMNNKNKNKNKGKSSSGSRSSSSGSYSSGYSGGSGGGSSYSGGGSSGGSSSSSGYQAAIEKARTSTSSQQAKTNYQKAITQAAKTSKAAAATKKAKTNYQSAVATAASSKPKTVTKTTAKPKPKPKVKTIRKSSSYGWSAGVAGGNG